MDEDNEGAAVGNKDALTILLLGETGVGKSTWINGFANFLQFESLAEAEHSSTLCVIPSSFTITDDNYVARVISTGYDKNEVTEVGQSATQHPQSYLFPKDGRMVRLIDTPGIGDVRGVEKDKKNFEMILDHISHLDDLHAICILLKPNNARLNIMFSFCIKELLAHLHKDACRNIVFCFTNSRSTFYRPGDTLPALRKLLKDNDDVDITLNQSTMYCMDNEAIRFLYALKEGIRYTDEERKNYIASWEKSVNEINRLLNHASKELPHKVQSTLSLNNARQTILALGCPMAEVTRNIQINIANLEDEKQRVLLSQQNEEPLNLASQKYVITMRKLEEPRTVCTEVKCVEFLEVGRQREISYKTHCHNSCESGKQKHYKIANIVGHKKLRKCSAFLQNGNCKQCGCHWKGHMKITSETVLEVREITDADKVIESHNSKTAIKKIQSYLRTRDENINELRNEQRKITNASVIFAQFLRENAMTLYNDSMEIYLQHFIDQEKNKVDQGGNSKVLLGLTEVRREYQSGIEIQKEKINTVITLDEIERCIGKLYTLKNSGAQLSDMMNTVRKAASSSYSETLVEQESFTAADNKSVEECSTPIEDPLIQQELII